MMQDTIKVRLPDHYGSVWIPDEQGQPSREARGGQVVIVPTKWAQVYGLKEYVPVVEEAVNAPTSATAPAPPATPPTEGEHATDDAGAADEAEVAQLRQLAEQHEVPLGRTRSKDGILAKLREAGVDTTGNPEP